MDMILNLFICCIVAVVVSCVSCKKVNKSSYQKLLHFIIGVDRK